MFLILRIVTVASWVCLTSQALRADNSEWTSVQNLRVGERIGIIKSDQKRVEGTFAGATASAISVHTDQDVAVAKDDVVRVYRRPHLSRAVRALIGGGIGLAAGAVVNATAGERFRNEGGDITAGALLGGAAIGAGIGAATGGGYQTIYRRAPGK